MKRLFGQDYDSATAVGMQVKKLAPLLEAREAVEHDKKQTGKARVWTHVFRREII